jgi:hypothetical protein
MRKYAGQYVAVTDGKIVASGKNLYKKNPSTPERSSKQGNPHHIHPARKPTHPLKNKQPSPDPSRAAPLFSARSLKKDTNDYNE